MLKEKSNKKSFIGKGVFPHKWAFTLLIPIRNIFLSPKKLIQRLHLRKRDVVLELGCGPGYFSPKVAEQLPEGKLILADIQQQMLDKAKSRMQHVKQSKVEYVLCNGTDLPFDEKSIDRIFLVTVLGEIENKSNYLNEFFRILKDDGIVSVSELWGDADKMTKADLVSLFHDHQFTLAEEFGSDKNYTLNFKKV